MPSDVAPELGKVLTDASSPKCRCENCHTLYGLLKAAWSTFAEIEKASKELRKSFPEDDARRAKLLTIQMLTMMQLSKPRKAHRDLLALFETTLAQWEAEEQEDEAAPAEAVGGALAGGGEGGGGDG